MKGSYKDVAMHTMLIILEIALLLAVVLAYGKD